MWKILLEKFKPENIKKEIIKNCDEQSATEHIYWLIIAILIYTFGLYLKIWWPVLIVISLLVIIGGTIVLAINKQAVLVTATLFFVIWTFTVQNKSFNTQNQVLQMQNKTLETQNRSLKFQAESFEFTYRPYVLVDMMDPQMFNVENSIFYGNDILLSNKGKIPAFDILTDYYIATDDAVLNQHGKGWFERKYGGYGSVSYLYPGLNDSEPGIRNLSSSAEYYFFEAVTSYKGIDPNKKYWTHIRKVYFADRTTGKLYTVYTYGDWDRNEKFISPPLSTKEEVEAIFNGLKSKREIKNTSEAISQ